MSVRYWRLALVGWMGLIFLMSSGWMASRMSAEGTELFFGSLNYVARKGAHVAEFAVLTFLWVRSARPAPGRLGFWLIWSVALSIGYAVTDEIHQSFVPRRGGSWVDVGIDSVGAGGMGWFLWWVSREDGVWRRRLLGEVERLSMDH